MLELNMWSYTYSVNFRTRGRYCDTKSGRDLGLNTRQYGDQINKNFWEY